MTRESNQQPATARIAQETQFDLVLFVNGASTSSARAVRQVQALCERHLRGRYGLTIVDVRHDPDRSRGRVLATPTLIRQWPAPERKVLGDFSDELRVLRALEIPSGDSMLRHD